MTVVYEQFLYVLLQGYFKPVLSLRLVLLIYYDKTFGHEPGFLTRSVLNRQSSISFLLQEQSGNITRITMTVMHILK